MAVAEARPTSIEDYRNNIQSGLCRRLRQGTIVALNQHRIAVAKVEGPKIAPRFIGFFVRVSRTTDLSKAIGLTNEIAYAAGLGSGKKEAPIDVVVQGGWVLYYYALPKEARPLGLQTPVKLWSDISLDAEAFMGQSLAVGAMASGHLVYFGFSAGAPHTLVCGMTGSGKTELLKTIVFQLMVSYSVEEMGVAICDPEGDYDGFADEEHLLWKIATDGDEIKSVIQHVHTEFKRREALKLKNERQWVLVIDEADREHVLGDKENEERVLDIVNTGRHWKINLIIGTHVPDAPSIGAVRKGLGNRFLGRMPDASSSGSIEGGAGLHRLAGEGDFKHVKGPESVRFQVALVPDSYYGRLNKSDDVPVVFDNHIDDGFFEDITVNKNGRPTIAADPRSSAFYLYRALYGEPPVTKDLAETHLNLKYVGHKRNEKFVMEQLKYLEELKKNGGFYVQ